MVNPTGYPLVNTILVYWADKLEVWKDYEEDEELVDKYPEVESGIRTREIAAKKSGFGCEKTYRDAKTVVEKGTPELVEAMDEKQVSISATVKLTKKPED